MSVTRFRLSDVVMAATDLTVAEEWEKQKRKYREVHVRDFGEPDGYEEFYDPTHGCTVGAWRSDG